jgi:hypothetical protein
VAITASRQEELRSAPDRSRAGDLTHYGVGTNRGVVRVGPIRVRRSWGNLRSRISRQRSRKPRRGVFGSDAAERGCPPVGRERPTGSAALASRSATRALLSSGSVGDFSDSVGLRELLREADRLAAPLREFQRTHSFLHEEAMRAAEERERLLRSLKPLDAEWGNAIAALQPSLEYLEAIRLDSPALRILGGACPIAGVRPGRSHALRQPVCLDAGLPPHGSRLDADCVGVQGPAGCRMAPVDLS